MCSTSNSTLFEVVADRPIDRHRGRMMDTMLVLSTDFPFRPTAATQIIRQSH